MRVGVSACIVAAASAAIAAGCVPEAVERRRMRAAGAAPCAAVPVSAAATVAAPAAHPKLERRRLTLDGASPCSCAAAAGGAQVSWLGAAAQLARRARVAKTAAAATPLKEGAGLAAPLAALALAPRTLRLRCMEPRRGGGAGE